MTKYRDTAEGEVDPRDLNRDGAISPGELLLSTLIAAGCAVAALGALAIGVWVQLSYRGPIQICAGVPCLVIIICGALGVWRQLHYEVMYAWAKTDRERRQRFEDLDREDRDRLQGEVKGQRITQADVDASVELLLATYYKGRDWQRGTIKGLSDVRWNAANSALRKCGLRRGRQVKIEADTYEDAWRMYLAWRRRNTSFKVNDDGELISA